MGRDINYTTEQVNGMVVRGRVRLPDEKVCSTCPGSVAPQCCCPKYVCGYIRKQMPRLV